MLYCYPIYSKIINLVSEIKHANVPYRGALDIRLIEVCRRLLVDVSMSVLIASTSVSSKDTSNQSSFGSLVKIKLRQPLLKCHRVGPYPKFDTATKMVSKYY